MILAGLAPASVAQEGPDVTTGTFTDVTGGVHQPAIDALDALGVFDGTECSPEMFCPDAEMKRWTMAVWLVRVLDTEEPPAVDESSFADVAVEDWWLAHVERLAELEITTGCRVDPLRFCPERPVNRAQMATFLVRALDLEAAAPAGFADTEGNAHETNIDALAAAGVTAGCRADPLRYCPDQPVTRAQMATLLARALDTVDKPAAANQPAADEPAADQPAADEPPPLPGEGVRVKAGRANWRSGYFQAELYKLLLEELGYSVSDPAHLELDTSLAYLAMAGGDMDYWPNGWYPTHLAWHLVELPDGSLVGDHITVVGSQMPAGGLQGFLIDKSFADTYGVYTMDELNSNADALAAFDATDAVPGNGMADIYGCPEVWTCDNIIANMIAFSGWNNIAQTQASYDAMFTQAVDNISEGLPAVIYTWTPSEYVTRLRPGENVYWLGVEEILDDSNPADQLDGGQHSQRGFDGSGGYAAISADQCPSAAEQPDGRCRIGWLASDIQVTANNRFLEANPAAKALFEAVQLPMLEVAEANAGVSLGHSPTGLAAAWIADNRALVDQWLATAGGHPPVQVDKPDPPTTRATADAAACRPPGVPHITAGFPRPAWAAPSTGKLRVAVLFVDFPDAPANYPTHEEAALGLPYAEAYLEASSHGQLDVEFVPLHGWLRADFSSDQYFSEFGTGESRVNADVEAIRLADPFYDFTGIHAVMTVLPSSRFHGGIFTLGHAYSGEGLIRLMAGVNLFPFNERRDPSPWGSIGAHELVHSMGLLDLYPYHDDYQSPEPPPQRIWIRSQFGLMSLSATFLARPDDSRLKATTRYSYGPDATGYSQTLHASEMLAWSRWQLGWLDESQVLCLNADQSRVTLGPVADPGNEPVMAAVPLSETEVLVVEARRKVGYDAEQEVQHSGGTVTAFPALATEGLLVYVVDASLGSGELPIKVAGDSGNGQVDDYPILAVGDQVVVRGYTVTMVSDRGGTYIVEINKTNG